MDEAFCRYVWSLLAEQPSVIVGLVPEGGGSEVYIAPQPSKQKALGKKKKTESEDQTGRLNAIADASSRSLESLLQEYGNNLRVAVGPEACFEAITGTHTRVSCYTKRQPYHSDYIFIAACQTDTHGLYCSAADKSRQRIWPDCH